MEQKLLDVGIIAVSAHRCRDLAGRARAAHDTHRAVARLLGDEEDAAAPMGGPWPRPTGEAQ